MSVTMIKHVSFWWEIACSKVRAHPCVVRHTWQLGAEFLNCTNHVLIK
jgi:hypothetical protein